MVEREKFEFNREQAYRLIAVTDKNGIDKVHSRQIYESRINCIAINFHYDKQPSYEGEYCMNMTFVQDENGQMCRKNLHTS